MRLEVKDLKKKFGEKEVLHGISFSIESGKALGLLGRNGAGKTTTIRILMDVFKGTEGKITMDGKPFYPKDYRIGYLPEERGLYPKKTVAEQIIYLATLRGLSVKEAKESMDKWLKKLEVDQYKDKKLETLSKGNQQKVQLAQALVCNPRIVILDEPFSGLDPVNSQILKDVIRELIDDEKLVIFSSHQMSYVEEFCRDIVILNHGNVVLDGDLHTLQKEFGRGKLAISSTNYPGDTLEELFNKELSAFLQVCGNKNGQQIVTLADGVDQGAVLRALLDKKVEIENFGLYKPSLTDIFVERAGD